MLSQERVAVKVGARSAVLMLFVGCLLLIATPSFAAPGDCNSCHGTNVSASHHQSELYSQGLCYQCHEGVTTNGDCATCHAFVPQQNAHHDTVDATSGNCAQCHTNVGDLANCLDCHQGSIRTPHHSAATDLSNPIDCASCHTTMAPLVGCVGCHGGNVQTTHHTAAETNGISCQECHAEMQPVANCESCHNPTDYWDGQTAREVHHDSAAAQSDCTTCHANAPRPFNCHDCHQGEAADRHHSLLGGTLTCANCHDAIALDLKQSVADCQDCHEPSAANQQQHHDMAIAKPGLTCSGCHSDAGEVPGCATCHDAGYWGVDANSNPLTARDAHHVVLDVNPAVDCNSCHTALVFDNSCDSCHASGDVSLREHHNKNNPSIPSNVSCGFCHGPASDIPATNSCEFCHDAGFWAAAGGNTAMGQHHDLVLGTTVNDCQGCHDTLVPQTCATCHDNTFWASAGRTGSAATQHHDVVRVEGVGLDCADCHTGGLPGENNDCQACHSGEAATFHHETVAPSTSCQECHTSLPVVESCESCHSPDRWPVNAVTTHHASPTFAAGNCSQCHTSLPVVESCESCHTATTWVTDARTDHHDAAMNNSINCGTCHASITTPSGNCRSCHGDDWTYVDANGRTQPLIDPAKNTPVENLHHSTTTYSFGCLNCHSYAPDYSLAMPSDASCESCHATQIVGKEGSSTMHHATQAATSNDCGACHQGIENITQATLECTTCHSGQPGKDGSPTMHHNSPVATAPGASCSDCHTGIDPATLACATCHAQQTAVAGLDGTPSMHHASPGADTNCASCHQNVVALDCAGCHIDPTDPSLTPIPARHHTTTKVDPADCNYCHTGANTVVNDCEACHTGTTSEQAARHHATDTYANNACSTCHEGIDGVSGDVLDCVTCHAAKTLTGDAAMHHGTADGTPDYGVDNCATCHDVLDFSALVTSNECYNCHTGGNPDVLAGRHHATPPALAGNCVACHGVDQAELDCATCHASQPVLDGQAPMHHATATAMSGTCTDCHSSVDLINVTCTVCHASQPVLNGGLEMHHNTALATGGDCTVCHTGADSALMNCASCHDDPNNPDPNEIATRHHVSLYAQSATCTDCHATVNTSALDCGLCHAQQPATIDGSLTMHHEMTLAGSTNQCTTCHTGATIAEADCSACHSSDGQEIAAAHHATPTYQTGLCSACHVGAEARGIICASCHASGEHHTNSPQYAADSCNLCHTDITLNGANCEACHAAGALTIPELHHTTPLNNVSGDCSVCHEAVSSPDVCSNCHVSSPHHDSSWSQMGDCAHCHTVPAAVHDRPAQAACRECHGEYQHDKGGPIQNFGACAACHDTMPFHSKPSRAVGYTRQVGGRGLFNIFWSTFAREEAREDVRPNGEDMDDEGGRRLREPSLTFNMYSIEHGGQAYQVPGFSGSADYSGGADTGGTSGDLSICTSCHWDRSASIACTNSQWTRHLTEGWVDQATYQLAEAAYIGNLCNVTTPPSEPANLALDKPASSSDDEGSSYGASRAVDGDGSTRWYVRSYRTEWLKVDLGSRQRISQVVINWHSYYAREYDVEVSIDNRNWTRVYRNERGDGGSDTVNFSSREARYVRIECNRRDESGYSIYELEVYP